MGFDPVVTRKSISNGAVYYSKLLSSWSRAQLFLTLYPKFMGPLPGLSRLLMNATNLGVVRMLQRLASKPKSILMVQDLPIDQGLSHDKNALFTRTAYDLESTVFETFGVLCVFNALMRNKIEERYHIPNDRIVEFEMLDYAIEFRPPSKKPLKSNRRIVYAGNLGENYVGEWIEELPKVDGLSYEFLGFDGDWLSRVQRTDVICGGFIQGYESLAQHMSEQTDFAVLAVSDDRRNYCEYTATSKFSAYVSAGLPVIVPSSHAYISSLVSKYDVGIIVDTVAEIPEQVLSLSDSEYERIRSNCLVLGDKMREGFFFKRATNLALKKLDISS